jgi:hypothetical protein
MVTIIVLIFGINIFIYNWERIGINFNWINFKILTDTGSTEIIEQPQIDINDQYMKKVATIYSQNRMYSKKYKSKKNKKKYDISNIVK